MDHPLKADVVTTHRVLRKQCDPSELTKCTQTQTDIKVTLTHTNVNILQKTCLLHYSRKDITLQKAFNKITVPCGVYFSVTAKVMPGYRQ